MTGGQGENRVREGEATRVGINLSPIKRIVRRGSAPPRRDVEPFVKDGQIAADLGCRTGYYTFALADCVGPKGRVHAVDLDAEAIRTVQQDARERGYGNIDTYACSAADLSFLPPGSVDFVLANGLLCSMPEGRPSAVREIKRVLKPEGLAYLSLGMPPPFGHVDRAEWESILQGFRVRQRGRGHRVKRALVSTK